MLTTHKQTVHSFTQNGADYIWTMQSDQLGQYWPEIVKFLQMIDNPEWSVDDVFEEISDKEAQVWGMVSHGTIKGIWITKIMQNSQKYGLVWIAAGSGLEEGLPLFLSCTERWFKEMGCEYVKIFGRRGWKKALPGYVEHSIELRKVL